VCTPFSRNIDHQQPFSGWSCMVFEDFLRADKISARATRRQRSAGCPLNEHHDLTLTAMRWIDNFIAILRKTTIGTC
jgi:hypothetical protein